MKTMLRFDGLYVSDLVDATDNLPYRYYLRFYEDGTVISSSVVEPAEVGQIMRWFDPNHKTISRGHYDLDGSAIRFSTVFEGSMDVRDGTVEPDIVVDYKGDVGSDFLRLRSHSRLTDHRDDREYRFLPASK